MTAVAAARRPDRPRPPDEATVIVRPLQRDDAAPLLEIFEGLSPRSREQRFLAPKPTLTSADLRQLTAVDGHDHVALAAFSVVDDRPIAVGRFVRSEDDSRSADVAVAVVDAWQGRGVGTLLATALSERARELGIARFSALMAQDNEAAARLMHRTSSDVELVEWNRETADFVIHLAPPTRPRRRARALLKGT